MGGGACCARRVGLGARWELEGRLGSSLCGASETRFACCAHRRLAADATAAAPRELTQEIVRLKGGAAAQKEATLLALCSKSFREGRTIVFAKTKQRAHRWVGLGGAAWPQRKGEAPVDLQSAL